MASLLDYLRNAQPNGTPNDPLSQIFGIAPTPVTPNYTGVQAPQMPQGAPQVPQAPPPMQQALTSPSPANGPPGMPQAPQQPDDITVTGDSWKPPAHQTLLGGIADYLVGNTHFKDQAKLANMKSAMSGFDANNTDSIQTAISRVEKVDPAMSWNMYNTWQDNTRADRGQSRADLELKQQNYDKVGAQVGALVGASNSNNWDKTVAFAKNIAKAKDIDYDSLGIPSKFDQDYVSLAQSGQVTPGMQAQQSMMASYYKDRTDNYTKMLKDRQDHQDNMDDRMQGREDERVRNDNLRAQATSDATHAKIAHQQSIDRRFNLQHGVPDANSINGPNGSVTVPLNPSEGPVLNMPDSMNNSSNPPPPRRPGDVIHGPGGIVLTSRDGKTWSR